MSHRAYLLGIGLATALAGAAFALVVTRMAPEGQAGGLAVGSFFVTGFFALAGIFSLVNFWLRRQFLPAGLVFSHLHAALRQGAIAALFALGLLGLSHLGVLTWWDAAILGAIAVLLEMIFSSEA